jgi:hypothetical protein
MPKTSIKTTPRPRASSANRRSAEKQAPPSTDAKPAGQGSRSLGITAKERYKMIAHLAYLGAEKRGFAPGHELDDWLQAESEVDQMLHGGYGR